MKRRTVLKCALAATFAAATSTSLKAHTPYRQWEVYRRKHLLIGCYRNDPSTYAIAKGLVATLDFHLPKASSRVARGPNAGRIASLIATGQMDVAVLHPEVATSMMQGRELFAAWGPIALSSIMQVGDYLFVANGDFPDHHAWLVAEALEDRRSPFSGLAGDLPHHPGADAFHRGLPMPHSVVEHAQ